MNKLIVMIATAGIMFTANAFAGPTEDVKRAVDEVVRIVSDKELKKNDQKRRLALKNAISTVFDYSEMAKRSLGKHWNRRTAVEKKHFVGLFASLLENSYASKIESYNNEKIIYLKESLDGDYAEVKSKVLTAKRDEFTLDYRLVQLNGKWLAYDVVIEGVSLVSNYRTQFNKIINTNGYQELIVKLENKTEEIKAP